MDDWKFYSTVEKMDDFEYSLEIIIVPLKERIAETNFFFLETYYCWKDCAQAMDNCKISRQNKYSIF